MSDEIVQQTTLRDTLSANVEAAEAGILETPEQVRARDEGGRFVRHEEKAQDPVVAKPIDQKPVEQSQQQRPTTWKKDYLPMWDKLATGQPLTPDEAKKLAEYTQQRENEYKTGVSTYKAEAMQAKELQEAVTPFLPELQAHNLRPSDWIKQLGQTHYVLVRGSPQQKLQAMQAIANQYGVPLAAVPHAQQQVPALVSQLLQKISDLQQQVSGVNTWKQSLEMQSLQGEIQKFAGDSQTYPHFDAVRERMAQLLETGAARDLPMAYKTAVRENDELYNAELDRVRHESTSSKANVVASARAKAVSPKSATPSGQVTTSTAKDRRSILAEQFDAMGGGRV